MKTFVIADIHGNYKALIQCLEKSKFNYKKDKLICLGDTCDGLPDVKECFDELLKIKNLIYLLGNHDEWAYEWYGKGIGEIGQPKEIWASQGGQSTLNSYGHKMLRKHLELIHNSKLYHIENIYDDSLLFVHGGIIPCKPIEKQDKDVMLWDRDLIRVARHKHHQKPTYRYGDFANIYLGHTTTQSAGKLTPIQYCNITMMDTGAGWSGKLTIMDINTRDFWQSDLVKDLYDVQGRG